MLGTNIVAIPLQRYEELIRIETRVNTVVERIMHSELFDKEDILWLLDTEVSVEFAQELHARAEKEREKWLMRTLEEG